MMTCVDPAAMGTNSLAFHYSGHARNMPAKRLCGVELTSAPHLQSRGPYNCFIFLHASFLFDLDWEFPPIRKRQGVARYICPVYNCEAKCQTATRHVPNQFPGGELRHTFEKWTERSDFALLD